MPIPLTDKTLLRNQGYINGRWTPAQDRGVYPVTNPATGDLIAEVASMGSAETELAISAASVAWPAWRSLTAKARATILKRWFELILAHGEDLAQLITAEQGKPLAEAQGEVNYGGGHMGNGSNRHGCRNGAGIDRRPEHFCIPIRPFCSSLDLPS